MGNKVREFREEKLMSRGELAQASKLSISTLSRIEQGKAYPSLTTMRKILNALGVPREKKDLVFPARQQEYN